MGCEERRTTVADGVFNIQKMSRGKQSLAPSATASDGDRKSSEVLSIFYYFVFFLQVFLSPFTLFSSTFPWPYTTFTSQRRCRAHPNVVITTSDMRATYTNDKNSYKNRKPFRKNVKIHLRELYNTDTAVNPPPQSANGATNTLLFEKNHKTLIKTPAVPYYRI